MNDLEAAITFLQSQVSSVGVMGEPDLPDPLLSPLCVLELSGDGATPPLSNPERIVRYTVRIYGPSDIVILDAYDLLRAGCMTTIPGIPKTNIVVGDRWMKWFQLSGAFGPTKEPDTERPVLLATAAIKWAY